MSFKGVVFDMDGVIRIGKTPVEGINDLLEVLAKGGIRAMICTNECRYTEDELREDLDDMGVNWPPGWPIYTSGMATRDYLAKRLALHPSPYHTTPQKTFHVGIIGEKGLFETLNELTCNRFRISKEPPPELSENDVLFLVIGTVSRIKISALERGLAWLKAGAKVITTCSDLADPSSKGSDFVLGMPNHILHLLKYSVQVGRPYSLGKPHPIFAQKISWHFEGLDPQSILFVGDTIHTDIQLAEEHDYTSCLVLSGNTKVDSLDNYTISPLMVKESVKDLVALFL